MIIFFLLLWVGMQLNAPIYYYIILTIWGTLEALRVINAAIANHEKQKLADELQDLLEEMEAKDGEQSS